MLFENRIKLGAPDLALKIGTKKQVQSAYVGSLGTILVLHGCTWFSFENRIRSGAPGLSLKIGSDQVHMV